MAKKQNQGQSGGGGQQRQTQRVGIFGASGSGKTTKARELIQGLDRVVCVDPLGDFRNLTGAVVISGDLVSVKNEIVRRYSTGFKIVFVPIFGQVEKQLNDLCYFLVKMQAGFLAGFHDAQITLVVDELDEGFASGIMQRNSANGFGYLCKRGRHYGINLVGISQRTAQVDVCFRGNLSALYLFRHADPIDTQKAVDMIGREYKKTFINLPDYHYIFKSGQKIVVK